MNDLTKFATQRYEGFHPLSERTIAAIRELIELFHENNNTFATINDIRSIVRSHPRKFAALYTNKTGWTYGGHCYTVPTVVRWLKQNNFLEYDNFKYRFKIEKLSDLDALLTRSSMRLSHSDTFEYKHFKERSEVLKKFLDSGETLLFESGENFSIENGNLVISGHPRWIQFIKELLENKLNIVSDDCGLVIKNKFDEYSKFLVDFLGDFIIIKKQDTVMIANGMTKEMKQKILLNKTKLKILDKEESK